MSRTPIPKEEGESHHKLTQPHGALLVTVVIEPTDVCHLHLIQTSIADSRLSYTVDCPRVVELIEATTG